MKLGIPKELRHGERRVAASPAVVAKWVKAGWDVVVQADAGAGANFADADYAAVGAVISDAATAWGADVVVKVNAPTLVDGRSEADAMQSGATLIAFIYPAENAQLLTHLAARKVTVLAMDAVPRISRAQKMDALSSMANISGYRAVVEAASYFPSFFTGQFTAAGKVPPAKVLIIGAGVAGLAALGAARGLGAIVRAFDVRAAAEEQVKSLGGEFLTVSLNEAGEGQGGYAKEMSQAFLDAEMALFRAQAAEVDIVITTALIPGRPAPKLWLEEAVRLMKPGSVVVDLAAEKGGNCECTEPGRVVTKHGVTIIGAVDFPSRMASVASEMYGTNLAHFLDEMGGAKNFAIDHNNDAVRPALILERGETRWPPPKVAAPSPTEPRPAPVVAKAVVATVPVPTSTTPASKGSHGHGSAHSASAPSKASGVIMSLVGIAAAAAWLYLRATYGAAEAGTSAALLSHMTVFVMAVFVGWQVVWNVAPALHTPLMSVTNAISGIIIVGGILQGRSATLTLSVAVAVAATLFATINIAGGFLVTRRMLAMFRK